MNYGELMKTIYKSVYETNEKYEKWSGGYWTTEYGLESLVVADLANAIMDPNNNPPTYLTLEESFAGLEYNQGKKHRGAPRKNINSRNKLDMALYYGEFLSYAIEVKCRWSNKTCLKDMDRLCELYRSFGKKNKGTMVAGVFVLLIYGVAKENESKESFFTRRYNYYKDIICEHQDTRWRDKKISTFKLDHSYKYGEENYIFREDTGFGLSTLTVTIK